MRALYLVLIFVFAAEAAVLDRVAVVVGDDVITESEVMEELRLDQFMASQALDLSAAERRAAADHLVDQQLIRHEMEISHYLAPKPSEADAMLQTLRRQRFPDEAEYRSALEQYGITEDQVKQHLLWQLSVLRFTDERFAAGVQQPAGLTNGAPPSTPPPVSQPAATPQNSADRVTPDGGEATVDQQMDAWLKDARSSTHIEFKKEAFQ